MRHVVPIGRNISDPHLVSEILHGESSPASGAPNATLRLAVFTDYSCPACRYAFPELEAALRRDGDVRVIYKDWPIFGAMSERAARVALASAEQGIYPAFHQRLMKDGRVIDDEVLRETVISSGGDWSRIERYLSRNADYITARLQLNGQEALSIGLQGTPGYLARAMLVIGAKDRSEFTQFFREARAAVEAEEH